MYFSSAIKQPIKKWMLVYHTQPSSQEVEPINEMLFADEASALRWLINNKNWDDFIQPEAIPVSVTITVTKD